MPLYRRLPKVGFTSRVGVKGKNVYSVVRLSVLERLDSGTTVDLEKIKSLGYAKKSSERAGVKVLCDVEKLTKKLHLKVDAISANAKALVEAAGGSVEILSA
jgi:large subunit ribosomal protein L15